MFKNIVAPVQAWLLIQGRCVGCGLSLKTGKTTDKGNNLSQINCKKCKRVYILDKATNKYRRALPNEVQ